MSESGRGLSPLVVVSNAMLSLVTHLVHSQEFDFRQIFSCFYNVYLCVYLISILLFISFNNVDNETIFSPH